MDVAGLLQPKENVAVGFFMLLISFHTPQYWQLLLTHISSNQSVGDNVDYPIKNISWVEITECQ